MNTAVLWKGISYDSLEYFKIQQQDDLFIVNSRIIGTLDSTLYSLGYHLKIDVDWTVLYFEIEQEVNNTKNRIRGDKQGNVWKINRQIKADFSDIDFIDISLSPFTNTLPINNLNLAIGQGTEIDVLYLDILANELKRVKQRYTRKGKLVYKYENIVSDFQADVEIDENGLVKSYPQLFERKIIRAL